MLGLLETPRHPAPLAQDGSPMEEGALLLVSCLLPLDNHVPTEGIAPTNDRIQSLRESEPASLPSNQQTRAYRLVETIPSTYHLLHVPDLHPHLPVNRVLSTWSTIRVNRLRIWCTVLKDVRYLIYEQLHNHTRPCQLLQPICQRPGLFNPRGKVNPLVSELQNIPRIRWDAASRPGSDRHADIRFIFVNPFGMSDGT